MKNVSIARGTVVLLVFLLSGHAAFSEPTPSAALSATEETNSVPPDVGKKIDDAATKMLSGNGVPSASVAVVKHGKLAYTKAYGLADIASHRRAMTRRFTVLDRSANNSPPHPFFSWPRKVNSRLMTPSDAGYPILHERTKLRSAKCSR